MAHGFNNRVWCDTSTIGTGNVSVGAARAAHCTPDDSGTADGDNRTWLLEEGNDFELFHGDYATSGAVVTRGTVLLSQIGGVTGTTRMNLAGTATIREVIGAEDVISKLLAGAFGLNMLGAAAVSDAWTLLDASAPASAAFRRGNILGAVGLSGGVPTGAVIEYGSNANGEYIKFADGTMICWWEGSVTQACSSANGSYMFFGDRNVTFPALFNDVPSVVIGAFNRTSNRGWGGVISTGLSSALLSIYSPISFAAVSGVYLSYVIVGRWT